MPERHEGSSQLHKCLAVDFDVDFDFDVGVDVDVGGGPRWARYEKNSFLYN